MAISSDLPLVTEGTPLMNNGETVAINVKDHQLDSKDAQSPRVITPSQRRYGYTICGLAALFQSLRATALHAVLSLTPMPISISFLWMAVVFLSITGVTMLIKRQKPWVILSKRPVLILWCFRGLSTSIMKYLNFVSLRDVAVGTALTIFATGPSIAFVFAFLFLRDPITFTDVGILVVNIVGVIFVASPGSSTMTLEGGDAVGTGITGPLLSSGLIACIGCAFFQAATTTMEKSLATAKIPVIVVLLAVGCGSLLSFSILIRGDHWAIMRAYPWGNFGLFVAGLLTFVTHGLLNYAMRFCRPGPVLVVRSLSVPFSFFLGYVFLSETPTLLELFGVCLVFSSLVFTGLS